jgi:hypothetical protein
MTSDAPSPKEAPAPALSYFPAPTIKANRLAALLLISSLSLSMLALVTSGATHLWMSDLWDRADIGISLTRAEVDHARTLSAISSLALPVTMLLSFALLLVWMCRTLAFVRSHGYPRLYKPVWAVIYWFVPYWNIIRPYEIMKQIYVVSRGISYRRFTPIVGGWWACWLLGNFVTLAMLFAGSRRPPDATQERWMADREFGAAMDIPFYLLAGILLICVIARVQTGIGRQGTNGLGSSTGQIV